MYENFSTNYFLILDAISGISGEYMNFFQLHVCFTYYECMQA